MLAQSTCSVSPCTAPNFFRRRCYAHYIERLKPWPVRQTRKEPLPIAERFWAKVDKSGDCWLWTGHKGSSGYGIFWIQRRPTQAHRLAYELSIGPIPHGLFACHHCDNPPCVRPAHLFLGTAKDNYWDARTKGRIKLRPKSPPLVTVKRLRGRPRKHVQFSDPPGKSWTALLDYLIVLPERIFGKEQTWNPSTASTSA